jgi:hypothetical protein
MRWGSNLEIAAFSDPPGFRRRLVLLPDFYLLQYGTSFRCERDNTDLTTAFDPTALGISH